MISKEVRLTGVLAAPERTVQSSTCSREQAPSRSECAGPRR